MAVPKKNRHQLYSVPKTGFEPARRFQRYHLKVVRLPISPPGHIYQRSITKQPIQNSKLKTQNSKPSTPNFLTRQQNYFIFLKQS